MSVRNIPKRGRSSARKERCNHRTKPGKLSPVLADLRNPRLPHTGKDFPVSL